QLRGVDSGGVLETLLERRLIKIAGRKEAAGRPMVYATTDEFLELFGMKDLESLPDLSEFREIERAVEQTNTGPVESIETHPEDSARQAEKDAAPIDPALADEVGEPVEENPAAAAIPAERSSSSEDDENSH
ncbi:MAG: scpB, partial [Candidatus Binatus sp.]|nr:scpB [Candidatus Binatus sp.]